MSQEVLRSVFLICRTSSVRVCSWILIITRMSVAPISFMSSLVTTAVVKNSGWTVMLEGMFSGTIVNGKMMLTTRLKLTT